MLSRILRNSERLALLDAHGSYTYGQLNSWACNLASHLKDAISKRPPVDGRQPRVAYLCPRDHTYVTAKFGAWHAGAIGVPIAENYPTAEIQYLLEDSGASVAVVHSNFLTAATPAAEALGVPIVSVFDPSKGGIPGMLAGFDMSTLAGGANSTTTTSASSSSSSSTGNGGAMLIYTSGTTGRPKGVLVQHSMLEAQVGAMSSAWGWKETDHIVNVLPLHHVHGVVAILLTSVWNGAVCELLPKFDASATWTTLLRPASDPKGVVSKFMAVPTVYARLTELYDKQTPETQALWSSTLKTPSSPLGLMVSGSAALPEPLALRWKAISGHTLLERYGMTEFSMAVSNPLTGERKLNSVGAPLPGYEARIVPEDDDALSNIGVSSSTSTGAGSTASSSSSSSSSASASFAGPGELQIRGPGVFSEYWNKPQATAETFTADGWFKTGDCATRDDHGYYFILGRMSADILKSGGYKISALDIERVLLDHPDISELAVLGVPDAVYGERVAAVVVLKPESALNAVVEGAEAALNTSVKAWAKEKLAPYKIPSVYRILKEMPRNAMGKVNKKELRKSVF